MTFDKTCTDILTSEQTHMVIIIQDYTKILNLSFINVNNGRINVNAWFYTRWAENTQGRVS